LGNRNESRPAGVTEKRSASRAGSADLTCLTLDVADQVAADWRVLMRAELPLSRITPGRLREGNLQRLKTKRVKRRL